MRLLKLSQIALAVTDAIAASEPYPKIDDVNQLAPKPYHKADPINDIQCIQRQIDTGEHKFDEDNNIVYGAFPTCSETGEPLSLKFGSDGLLNCTFVLTDEIFHLFQLYIHEDTPFSCRVHNYKEKTGGLIPMTFNFRGNLESSHLDIDPKLNIVATYNEKKGSIQSLVAFGSGSSTSKYIIGDKFTLQLNQFWHETQDEDFYIITKQGLKIGNVLLIAGITMLLTGVILLSFLYNNLSKKALKLQHKEVESKYD